MPTERLDGTKLLPASRTKVARLTATAARICRYTLRPEPWLAAILLGAVLFGVDAMRSPQQQVSVRVFAASVDGYHRYIHPFTGRFIRCRYNPTCSNYSVQAVRKYGIAKGGWMGLRRIARCRPNVPMGTADPVR